MGPIAYLQTGASRQVILHEFGHVKQTRGGYFRKPFRNGFNVTAWTEWEADWKAGTANYSGTMFLIDKIFGREVADAAMLYNNYLTGSTRQGQFLIYNIAMNPENFGDCQINNTCETVRELLLLLGFIDDASDRGLK